MLTDERLKWIEDTLNAASPSPWNSKSVSRGDDCIQLIYQYLSDKPIAILDSESQADAFFIASARGYVAELLSEVKRLRTLYRAATDTNEAWRGDPGADL
jgi:hypothetical protein